MLSLVGVRPSVCHLSVTRLHQSKTFEVRIMKYSPYSRDLRSFVIRFDFESYVRFKIRFVSIIQFEIFESSVLSIVIRKETIGGG